MNQKQSLEAMDQAAEIVAMWTGVRQQFIDAGWLPMTAEEMCLELLKRVPE